MSRGEGTSGDAWIWLTILLFCQFESCQRLERQGRKIHEMQTRVESIDTELKKERQLRLR